MITLFLLLMLLASDCSAQLVPMSDEELPDITGQAFIQVDRSSHSSLQYTKVSLGLDVKTNLSVDKLELGRYDRSGEAPGSSDLVIDDFALGHIGDDGVAVPFQIVDPFVELAYDDDKTLVGFRVGLGEAFGKLSGEIKTLTGNIDVSIYGQGAYLGSQMGCTGGGFFDRISCRAARLFMNTTWADDTFASGGELVHASGPNKGEKDPIRASHVGIPNGDGLHIPDGSGFTNLLVGLFTSDECNMLSVSTCFPLTSYRTLDVGDKDTGAFAKGMFLSFQSKPVNWRDDGKITPTHSGVFFNVPNGSIKTSFPEALEGIPRVRTRYYE